MVTPWVKTGTGAETAAFRQKYLVSFIGSVPADNPQVAIYVVVDEANSEDQAHSYYAQSIAREILKEALPYLGIYPDEELTGVNEGVGITGEGVQVEQTTESWRVKCRPRHHSLTVIRHGTVIKKRA